MAMYILNNFEFECFSNISSAAVVDTINHDKLYIICHAINHRI